MNNPLTRLYLDNWCQVVMIVSTIVILLSAAGLLNQFPVDATACISLGSFFVGLGEWSNHPLQTKIITAGGIFKGYPRKNNTFGLFFVFLGFFLIAFGLYTLSFYSGEQVSIL